jgi:MFS transporter, FHS family, glucose/mannose:H+ symporter
MSKIKHIVDWPIIFIAFLTLFSLGLLDNARGPYFPDITSDLKLTDTMASLFFAVASTVAFFSGRIVPKLVQKLGLMNVMRLGQVLMGLGFASISLAKSLPMLILTCALFGYGFGLINVAQNLLIIEGSSGDLRRRLFSGLHGMYAFASLISPLVAATLFQLNIGWREAYVGFACVVSLSFISTFFAKGSAGRGSENVPVTKNPDRKSYFLVGSMISLYIVAELMISTRLSLYVRRVFDYSPQQASMLLALFFLLLLAGRLFFLFVPLKATNLKIIEMSLVTSLMAFGLGLWVHPVFLTLCGLTMAPVFGLSIDLLAVKYPQYSSDAIASCLALSCVYIVSMHFLMGYFTDVFGIQRAMNAGIVVLLISYLLLLLMKKKGQFSDASKISL